MNEEVESLKKKKTILGNWLRKLKIKTLLVTNGSSK